MIPDYDKLAPIYDRLARLVFGTKLELAKAAHLDLIKPENRILVVGGGSGSILRYLDAFGIICQVDFVEVSKVMTQRARRFVPGVISVEYYEKDILTHYSDAKYDIIITNFFFDQYNRKDCQEYLLYLKSFSHSRTQFFYADFVMSGRIKDRFLKYLMYAFFRNAVKIGKVQLIDHKSIFLRSGLKLEKTKTISSFIVSEVYQISQ